MRISIKNVFNAGRVRRWHTHPNMSHTEDYNDAHQGRVARLLLALHPRPSPLLIAAALTHDDGELGPGDMSREAKDANPKLRDMLQIEENKKWCQIWNTLDIPRNHLSDDDLKWLKFCDGLDAFMWVRHKHPELLKQPYWIETAQVLSETAEHLGIYNLVWDVLE